MSEEDTFKNMDNINIDNTPFYKRRVFLIAAAAGLILIAIIIIVAATSGNGKDSKDGGKDSTDDGKDSKENICVIGEEMYCLTCVKNSRKCATCNPGFIVNENYNNGERCDIDYSINATYKTEKDNEEIDLLDSKYKDIITGLIVDGVKKDIISYKYKFPKAGSYTVLLKTNLENISTLSGMFASNRNIIYIGTTKLFNIATIVNMEQMFSECPFLETANLLNLQGQNLQKMDKLFYGCSSLKKVDLLNFKASQLNSISEMFLGCVSLTSVNLLNFSPEKLESTESMFSDLPSLTYINLLNFKAENLKYMNKMFYNCQSLKSINLLNFESNSLVSMDEMCFNCYKLTSINLGNAITPNLESLTKMLGNCNSLQKVNLDMTTEKVKNMDQMFYNCQALTSFEFGKNFKASDTLSLKEMFYNCSSLEKFNYNFNTFTVSNIEKMFYKCSSLTRINLEVFTNTENAHSMDEMFYYCNKLTSIDISTFTTSLTSIKLFNELPSNGKITVKENFLSLIKDQIPSSWKTSTTK